MLQPRKINRILKETHGRAKCPYNPLANVTSLITEDGLYFAGTPLDFTGTDSAIVRDGDTNKLLRTLQYDLKWLNEPQFIGSFETDAYVYFLFREVAVEFMNCGKVRSRFDAVVDTIRHFATNLPTFSFRQFIRE